MIPRSLYRVFLRCTLLSLLLTIPSGRADEQEKIFFQGYANGKVTYTKFAPSHEDVVDAAGLEIHQEELGKRFIPSSGNPRLDMLEYGIATLKQPGSAKQEELNAQKRAQEDHEGIWADSKSTPPQSGFSWSTLSERAKKAIEIWGGIGSFVL